MGLRVTIHWTEVAKKHLAGLPSKVRKGLIAKIGHLQKSDPRQAGKPLIGPFQGYRRITHGRYRAIFRAAEEPSEEGAKHIFVKVYVVLVGIRKEGDRKDIYKVAQKLFELGLLTSNRDDEKKEENLDGAEV